MNEHERITAIESGRNPTFIANLRARLNEFTGVVVHDAFWLNKGDLAIGKKSREAGRLPVGADGHVLIADSAEEMGVKWGAPGGSGGGAKSVTLIVGPAANADSADYDYTTDGTADDVQIQAAIDALTTGGTIVLREGTYTLDSQVNVDNPDLIFRGVGERTVVTVKNTFDFATPTYPFYLTGARPKFEYIKFDGNDTNQTDAWTFFYIDSGATDPDFKHCAFTNNGGFVVFVNEIVPTFFRCRFVEWGTDGGGYNAIEAHNSLSRLIIKLLYCYFESTDVDSGALDEAAFGSVVAGNYSVIPNGFDATWFNNCGGSTTGNYFTGGSLGSSGKVINGDIGLGLIANNYIDVGGDVLSIGIYAVGVSVVGNYVTGCGVGIRGGSVIEGNFIETPQGHGIYLDSSRTICSNNKIVNAGQAADNTYDGIFVNTGVDRCVITGNIISNASGTDHRYGINISAATCDNNIVSNNILTDAQTAQFNDAGTGTVTDGSNITT